MKALTAIFSYNRPVLLRNCVESYLEFGPSGDLMVIDDGSNLPEQQSYLHELRERHGDRVHVWIRNRNCERRLGGLYSNMEAVAQLAADRNYDLVLFAQDDQQFMWRDDHFWEKVQAIFNAHPQTLVVRPVFDKLIFSHDYANRFAPDDTSPGVLFRKSWFAAVGVVRPAFLRASDWHFRETEVLNNEASRERGFAMYLLEHPILAFVPLPETWRFGRKTTTSRPPLHRYFLHPLDAHQIAQLRAANDVAYLEDYCLPWGWRAWAPYDLSDDRRKYLKNLWRWFKKNRFRRWPKWQGVA